MLKRVAIVGTMVLSLAAGSMLAQPVTTASASVLPDSHVGVPDVGYPGCPSSCRFSTVVTSPSSGDIGYPGCPSGCAFEAPPIETIVAEPDAVIADLLPPSGDVGYPGCPGCRVQGEAGASPAPSGDVGYPNCPSGCRSEAQPDDTIVAAEPGVTIATLLPPSGDVGYPRCVCSPSLN
jgi:hypothetical protein